MRATIIGPAYPLRGGIAHHVYWLHQQLTSRGHEVQVISFRKLYPEFLFPGKTELDSSNLRLDTGAERILSSLGPATWREATSKIVEFSPDVVVVQWWQPFFGMMTGTLARSLSKHGLRLLVECHNVFPHERTPVDRILLRYAFSRVDSFITHSDDDRNALEIIRPGSTITVSPLPTVSEFAKRNRSARSEKRILFFGKVRKYKGLSVLLEAMPHVLKKIECELVIAGEFYDGVEKYKELIERLGLQKQVSLEDRYIANEEVPSFFEQADVLVLPYLSATQSGVARIALSNGVPIIASDTGGLSEVAIDGVTGMLVKPGDAVALANRIIEFFENDLGPVFEEKINQALRDRLQCSIIEIIEKTANAV